MIQINDIRINPQAYKLIIDAEIISDYAFSDCYLDHIYIDTQDSYLTSGPSDDIVYEHNITQEDAKNDTNSTALINGVEKVKKLHIEIPQESICASLKSNFFIIYLEADGIVGETENICETDKICVGAVFWMRPLYSVFLSWIREITKQCEVPKHFIYTHLQYHALLVSVRTGNMLEALKIYNKYFHNISNFVGNTSGCNCRR